MRIIPSHTWNTPSFSHGSLWWRDKTGAPSFFLYSIGYTHMQIVEFKSILGSQSALNLHNLLLSQKLLNLLYSYSRSSQHSSSWEQQIPEEEWDHVAAREAVGFLRMRVVYQTLLFAASRFFSILRRTISRNSTEKCQSSNHVSVLCKDTESQGASLGTYRAWFLKTGIKE